MENYSKDNELYHFGVKGMKWGVRRSPSQLGRDVLQKRVNKKAVNRLNDEKIRRIKKSTDKANKKIDAEYSIKKYGGKEKAIQAQVNKAKARSVIKKGALYTTSLLSTMNALNFATTVGAHKAFVMTGHALVSSTLAGPIGALSLAALGVGSSIAASKVKSKLTRNEQSKINYIKRS